MSRKKIEKLEGGKRIALGEKKNITDFALWKFSKPKEKRQQEWDSPWGVGFPGWHIECSAMASKYLGKHFDIHTGGEDHIPIHHENEIAQSEATFGKSPWVNYWMHNGFLNFKGGKKMSKSTGAIKTIGELEEGGINPLVYKYFNYSANYRRPLTWSEEAIENAAGSYKRLRNIIGAIENDGKANENYLDKFRARINDDLDMPGAMAILWELIRDKKAKGKVGAIKKMDEVFGLDLLERSEVEVPADIKKLADKREKVREEKDWKKSDELRDKLKDMGWIVRDGKDGYKLEKIL